ncbi:replication region DNA-binding N-term [Burkholderia sp. D7]|nr:replication region DNA-binding N-term [Burkholderia sp. D7]
MPRPAAVSADQIRTTVLAMLAEAGMDNDHQPPSGERFRHVVSVRKLRARLGAGDPATLARILNTIETEVVRAGLAGVAIPGLPDTIAEQMRTLWQAAVAVQLDEVVKLKAEASDATEAADAARRDADLRVELLRAELAELREQISTRDTALATVRAECRVASGKMTEAETATLDLRAALASANASLGTANAEHAAAIAAVHARYEGLSRQLLLETEHQREAWRSERERLSGQITQAQERTAAFEGLRERLLTDLASERESGQRAAAEAAALTTLVAEQRALLQAIQAGQAGTRRPARSAAVPSPAPGRHRRTLAASTSEATPAPASSAARRKAR